MHDWVLNPGDMLYLPPQWAHNGIAIGECTTYSIGFRSPSYQELAQQFLGYLQDTIQIDGIDRAVRVTNRARKAPGTDSTRAARMVAGWTKSWKSRTSTT